MYNFIKYFVDLWGESFVALIGLLIGIVPYFYQLIMSANARMTYTSEDIKKGINEEIDKIGEKRFMTKILLYATFKLVFIFGLFAFGMYIINTVNTIVIDYIHAGLYESMKHWPWD